MKQSSSPKVVVCFPARNEEKCIAEVLDSLKNQTLMPYKVIIANDGSTDNTEEIINRYEFTEVNNRAQREGTVVGKIEMAKVWNDSITPAEKYHEQVGLDYILFLGGDLVLPPNYIEDLVGKFENDQNVMAAAGKMVGEFAYKASGFMLPGGGRMMRYSYWLKLGGKYPTKQGWEAYPVYHARMEGYWTGVFDDIEYYPLRETGGRTDYHAYGEAMKALGYFPPFAIGRILKQPFIKGKGIKAMFNMFRGYIFSSPEYYEEEVRKFVNQSQRKRIKRILRLSRSTD